MSKAEKFAKQIQEIINNSEETEEILDLIQHESVSFEEYNDFTEYEFRDHSILTVGEDEIDFVN